MRVPDNSKACKKEIERRFPSLFRNPETLKSAFPKSLLQEKRKSLPTLEDLLNCFVFNKS